jgi:flagellar biosynthesis protein FlhA
MSALARIFGRNTDLIVIALVMSILLVLFAPIPPGLLDCLILLNFSLALLVLLMTFYAPRPVDFSTFPAILLIATLFRLSLNVSATRLILVHANAGRVIGAVGTFVVGGNYVVGLIVFLILVVVQYVVVTNGAQRVSEVAARFTLDSMPGQQMSVDADLNMGLIDQDEAKLRRKNLQREAAFYGAMDGASKFVKGDAIAGIVIMLINIIGGLVIGVLQQGMPWGEALHHYTLLTIGDGIVTQIPALVISVGTGLIVTRSGSDSQLGGEVLRQLMAFPRTLAVVAVVLVGVALLPGMPVMPPLVIAGLAALSYIYGRRASIGHNTDAAKAKASAALQDEDPYAVYEIEALDIELGAALTRTIGGTQGALVDRVAAFRTQYSQDSGLVIPRVRFRENATLGESDYRILVFGEPVATARIEGHKILAIHPAGDLSLVPGTETREPTYGLPALWIEESAREAARKARYTLVEPPTVLFTHLCEVIRQRSADLLTRAETERMLARVRTMHPGLVEELVPTQLALSDVQKVLQNLVREKVPVRNLRAIVEGLIDGARVSKDPAMLTEGVRQRLAHSICNSLSVDRKTLHVLTLEPAIEENLIAATAPAPAPATPNDPPRRVDPRLLDAVLTRIAAATEKMIKSNLAPVMLCTPELRRHLRTLCERAAPHLRVISLAEVASGFEVRSFSSISLANKS